MSEQLSEQYQQALTLALQLPATERLAILVEIAESLQLAPTNGDEETWTAEEIAEMTHVEPLPPQEIITRGLLGTWADYGIIDGTEWVNEQKRLPKFVISKT